MESNASLLNKCKEICSRYEKKVPSIPKDELFYQFCDDAIHMAFLIAASDGYVDVKEIEFIGFTFGVHFDYNTLARSYGLDCISDNSFMKQIPKSIKTIAGLEKRDNPSQNCFLDDTRVLYNTLKQFGDTVLNCTGARLQFSVMIQSYFINNILNFIFFMDKMDGFSGNQLDEVMTFIQQGFSNRKVEIQNVPQGEPEEKKIHVGGIRLKIDPQREGNQNTDGQNMGSQYSNGQNGDSQNAGNKVQDISDTKDREKSMNSFRGDMSLVSNASKYRSKDTKLKNDKGAVGDVIDMDTINEILAEVDALIGLGNVKKEIHDMVNMILINEMRRRKGLKTPVMSRHLVFTGNPGTGKTTIARAIGRIYKTLGILEQGHMIETDRSGMVAGYMGQTAEKVNEIVKSAMGGILFIDEAYSLVSEAEGDFGQEAINTLLKLMEDNRDNLVVIVAGYTEEMQDFINSNPGLRSRFNRYIQFNDYSDDELLQIFKLYVTEQDFSLEEGSDEIIMEAIKKLREDEVDNFGNARSVRNYFENVITNQANRLMDEGGIASDTDELMLIKCVDLKRE